jgi:hypothetical protein
MKTGYLVLTALAYLTRFLLITSVITLAGALAGAALFVSIGTLIDMDLSTAELLRNGLFDGGFLALIWAPGAAIVLLFVHAHRKRAGGAVKNPNGLDSVN